VVVVADEDQLRHSARCGSGHPHHGRPHQHWYFRLRMPDASSETDKNQPSGSGTSKLKTSRSFKNNSKEMIRHGDYSTTNFGNNWSIYFIYLP